MSFSHFATTTFDSPLIAVASTPIFIGLLGGAAPAGLAGLWWVATSKPNQLLFQEFFCKIGWLASIATPFGNLAVQVCKVAFHPQLKRMGFLEASGPGPLSRQPADPPLPSGGAAVFFALFHIILYEGIIVFKDRRALRPLAWVKTRVSKARATAMPDDVAAERARVEAVKFLIRNFARETALRCRRISIESALPRPRLSRRFREVDAEAPAAHCRVRNRSAGNVVVVEVQHHAPMLRQVLEPVEDPQHVAVRHEGPTDEDPLRWVLLQVAIEESREVLVDA